MAEWRSRSSHSGRPRGAADGTTKKTRAKDRKQAREQALKDLKTMQEKGYAIPKDQHALEAMTVTLEIMNMRDITPKDRLAAASKVLEYTMAKPASESTVNVKRAEDFLADLAKGNE